MKLTNLFIIINLLISSLLAQNKFLLDTNLTYIPASFGQSYPAITFDGTNYFVIWFDWRNRIPYHYEDSFYYNIYGCRVTPQGVVLDSSGILISYLMWVGGYLPVKPAIAYGAGKILCAWTDFRDNMMLYGARVDTNGIVLDTNDFVICPYDSWKYSPSATFGNKNFFVVWQDFQPISYDDIYGCRISSEGTILDPSGIAISAYTGYQGSPSVAFDGKNYLVAWQDNRNTGGSEYDIYGARVDTEGSVLDTNAIAICTSSGDQRYPAVTFGSSYYFVVWEDGDFSNIYGARVDTAGVLVDTNSILISTLPDDEYHPSLTFDGTNYLIAWSDYATIYCARVDTSGTVLDSAGIVVACDTTYEDHSASVAFDGTNYFIAWFSGQLGQDELYGARVETSGVVIDTTAILLSMCAYPGRSSAAEFDGANYFAVWTDYRDTSSFFIYGARIDTIGTVLDPDGIPIINGEHPAVAFDNTNYLVICSGMKGCRVKTTGAILDTITIFAGGDDPAVIFDGGRYFVTWKYAQDIYGARIDTAGNVLDTNGIIISNGEYYENYPSIAFDGTNYFVVWEYGNPITPYKIYGARVGTTGVLLDTISISIATDPWEQRSPSVAFDGTNYFVVWQDARNGWNNVDIYGTRVRPDGVILDTNGIPLCTASSCQYAPHIRFDNQNYCVIWEDWRNGDYTDIYGCYVNPSGTVIKEFLVSDQSNLQIEPTLAKGLNKFLVTYSSFTDSLGARSANTMRIWGMFQGFTGIEENGPQMQDLDCLLSQNFPNPFRQFTKIKYQLTDNSEVSLKIYDESGRLVRQFNYPSIKQSNQVIWDGKDDSGNDVSAGVYFYRLDPGNLNRVRKMILLK